MTAKGGAAAEEAGLAMRFAAVGLVGFAVDAMLLQAGLALHFGSAWARLASLTAAMQVTFAINRRFVFHHRGPRGLAGQWGRYMLTNGVGNAFGYGIFVTLTSLHGQWMSNPFLDLPISAVCAYLINYAGCRLVVFGRIQRRRAARGPNRRVSWSPRDLERPSP